ncbi:MAG: efflux RND transporter periplasmic adaptor subunit [Caldilineaceae bacterium]|nr:efflux RND transporter periplasmic adaptor subunit [Caldilineaceae bacterium]
MDINQGEQVSIGLPVLQLANLTSWEIRTEDLTELDIVGVEPGGTAAITFDAIPDLEMTGRIDRIRQIGTDQRGDIVYTVVVIPEQEDDRLLWNMTAVVTVDK